jgi:hypothetical protein
VDSESKTLRLLVIMMNLIEVRARAAKTLAAALNPKTFRSLEPWEPFTGWRAKHGSYGILLRTHVGVNPFGPELSVESGLHGLETGQPYERRKRLIRLA